jgi:hypothetical protein
VTEGVFGCCKYFFIFLVLLESMFDTRGYDPSFLSVERLV